MVEQIRAELIRLQDREYRASQIKLIPTVDPETVIGMRTPEQKAYLRSLKIRRKTGHEEGASK